MPYEIIGLPEVIITEEEERIFTAAERLLDYLQVSGAKLSREGILCHLDHLGVTEAQLPALLDTAERKGILLSEEEPEQALTDSVRLGLTGRVLLALAEECRPGLRESERQLLQLRFGLADRVPRTVAETARMLEMPEERVLGIEERILGRAARACLRKRRSQRLREFYT